MTKHIREIAPSGIENVSRRGVLKGILSTTGLVLAVSVLPQRPALAADAPKWGAAGMPHGTVNNPLAFVSIAPDGTVTIVCHRSEMGQGVRTGMPLIVADELEADWSRVKVAQATGDEVKYGNQDTDGSRSTRHFIDADAPGRRRRPHDAGGGRGETLGRRVSDVEAKNHEVIQKSTGKKLGYGELAADASKMGVPTTSAGKMNAPTPAACVSRILRSSATSARKGPISSTASTSRPVAPSTVRTSACPGMKYAVVARPPVMGGKVASYDATDAKKVPGVVQIVEIPAPSYPMVFQPSGGIAVVADNTWAAIQGRKALKIVWDDGPHATYDSQGLPRGARGDGAPAGHRSCAAKATSPPLLRARTRKSRPNTTSRTSRMRRWSRLRRPAESSTARPKSGRACKARRPRMIWSPSTWAFRPRTSRSM